MEGYFLVWDLSYSWCNAFLSLFTLNLLVLGRISKRSDSGLHLRTTLVQRIHLKIWYATRYMSLFFQGQDKAFLETKNWLEKKPKKQENNVNFLRGFFWKTLNWVTKTEIKEISEQTFFFTSNGEPNLAMFTPLF